MWKQKIGLGTNPTFGLPVIEQIPLLRKIGFEAFFTGWSPDAPVDAWAKTARAYGIEYQSIHGPMSGAADMWGADKEEGERALAELLECLAACEKNGVPLMISHTWIGFDEHEPPTEIGLERYGRLVRAAEQAGVQVAFENTEGEEFLAALLHAFGASPAVGYCWDSGHEMCYNGGEDLLAKYGQHLLCTHLNDNLGVRDAEGGTTFIDDLHLLPFDGIADWAYNARRLVRCGFDGVLTFELCNRSKPFRHENDGYAAMEPVAYLTEVYKRACRVAALVCRAREEKPAGDK